MRTLYPELTHEEYVNAIVPLRSRVVDTPPDDVLPVGGRPREHSLAIVVGPGVEKYSFEHICTVIAQDCWDQVWTPAVERSLDDPEALARAQVRELAVHAFDMTIRPLADLMGESGASTYEEFCHNMLQTGLTDLAYTYPVMWARLSHRLVRKVEALIELLERLAADREEVHRTIGIAAGTEVAAIQGSGDTHGRGRAVSVITFADGHRLVYKPRPVDCERAWTDIAGWVQRRHGLRVNGLTVLDRDGYGYVRFVTQCDADAEQDYREIGHLAAVLYALNAKDMHFTNILRTQDGPVAIDLETLLHPPRQKSTGLREKPGSAYRLLDESVYGTGVLPMVLTRRGDHGVVDVGFIGGGKVRGRSPFRQFHLENPFHTDLRVVWDDPGTEAPSPAVPPEAARTVHRRCAELVDGFTTVYRALTSDRAAFSAHVQASLQGRRIRYIHNPTVLYSQVLRMLTGTEASADPDLADGLLKRIAIGSRSSARELVESECTQVWQTDVPYFMVAAEGRDLLDAHGDVVACDVFEYSPLQEVERKLRSLSESDLKVQIRLIRTAFNAKLPDPHAMADHDGRFGTALRSPRVVDPGQLQRLATDLADGLVETQVEDRYPHLPRTWIGPVATAEVDRPWSPGVLGYDLYTGRVGPALALAALGSLLEERRHIDAAEAVLSPIAAILNDHAYEVRSIAQAGIGAYNGFAGTLWALAATGWMTHRPEYIDTAAAATSFLVGEAQDARWFDTISGGSGADLVQLRIAALRRAPIDAALVDRVDRACQLAVRIGLAATMEYSGLAHGVAGLIRYGAIVHQHTGLASARSLHDAALAALLERFHTGTSRGFRTNFSGPQIHSDSWCNGAAGLLIALADGIGSGLADPEVLDDLILSLRAYPISQNLTHCHGALGLWEAATWVACQLDHPVIRDLAADLSAHLGADAIRDGVHDPGSRYSQAPSLMAGRAGVALHLANRLQSEMFISPLSLGWMST